MRTIPTGEFTIISNNHQQLTTNLKGLECDSYDGNDYRDFFGVPFNYSKVFSYIIENLKADVGTLPEATNFDLFTQPTTQEEFNNHQLWSKLGFNVSDGFAIKLIIKQLEIEFYMSYGQKAGTILDFEQNKVIHDNDAIVWNALDSLIFDWGSLYDSEGNQCNGSEFLEDLFKLYKEFDGVEIENAVREYCSRYFHELDEDEDEPVVILESVISEDQIQAIIDILKDA